MIWVLKAILFAGLFRIAFRNTRDRIPLLDVARRCVTTETWGRTLLQATSWHDVGPFATGEGRRPRHRHPQKIQCFIYIYINTNLWDIFSPCALGISMLEVEIRSVIRMSELSCSLDGPLQSSLGYIIVSSLLGFVFMLLYAFVSLHIFALYSFPALTLTYSYNHRHRQGKSCGGE